MKPKLTVIEKVITILVIIIMALILFGCADEVKEIKRWEVKCFTETGVVTVVDTLEGGTLREDDGSIVHEPRHTQWHGKNAIYTGDCKAKMLESYYTETVY